MSSISNTYLSNTIVNSLFPSFVQHLSRVNSSYFTQQSPALLSGPGAPTAAWNIMFTKWEPIVYLNGGTLAMREAGTKYLPQEEGEENRLYLNRLTRSVLYGAYGRTVKTLSAMPFMSPMVINNLPEGLDYLLKNCNAEGDSVSSFSKMLLSDLINHGIAHILVEYPEAPPEGDLTMEQERELNMQAYFSRVDPMRLIGWKSESIGAKTFLTEIRIFEDVIYQDDNKPWEDKHRAQVRVVRPGSVELYQIDPKEKDAEYRLAHEPMATSTTRMNLVTIYANKTGFMQGAPLLEELAHLNIRHYQKLSDLDNIEHICNVPMAYAFGLKEAEFENVLFSPHTILKSGNENLKVGYLEHSGNAIPANQQSIKDLESRMLAMGADMLAPRGGSTRETGIAKTLDNTKSSSILQEAVEALEDGLEQAFIMAGEWMNIDSTDIKVNIGDKIGLTVDPNLLTSLIDLARNDNMSFEDLAKEMRKRSMLLDSTDLKKGKEVEMNTAQTNNEFQAP